MSNVHYIPLRSQCTCGEHWNEILHSIQWPFLCALLHHCKSISVHICGPQSVVPKPATLESPRKALKIQHRCVELKIPSRAQRSVVQQSLQVILVHDKSREKWLYINKLVK